MAFDKFFPSELLEKEVYRRKHLPFTYYCPACTRSFMARHEEEKCKFCRGKVKMITGTLKYVHYCENCDRRIEGSEPKKACEICGQPLLTLYRWDMLDKGDKNSIKISKALNMFKRNRNHVTRNRTLLR
jgi:rRNA maturation endonuclease Nob1